MYNHKEYKYTYVEYTVWHVDKYKITFKKVINHRTNEILVN